MGIFDRMKIFRPLDDFDERLARIPNELNELGYDAWGMNPKSLKKIFRIARWLFEDYFRVEVHGIENVPTGRVLLVPNHSGQVPLDGLLIFYAMFAHAEPPRVVRAMVERFVPRVPFVSTWMVRVGQVTGDPINCKKLLQNEEAVMVFPEGAKGSGKLYWHRYQLQKFGSGFLRLALETNTPIVPVAVIGAEEIYPSVYNMKSLAKLLKFPYFPITPTWPLLGPLGMIPMPVKVRLYFGEPMSFDGDFDGPMHELEGKVKEVVDSLQDLINEGLAARKNIFS